MSIVSSRKSLNSSILKSSANRVDSLKKTKVRFEVNCSKVKDILIELQENPLAKSYQNLIYKLSDPSEIKDEELCEIVTEAIDSSCLITKDHVLLVQSILNVKWIQRDTLTIERYHEFILCLLTSNDFLVLCLSKIVGCFVPNDDEADQWNNGEPSQDVALKLNIVHKFIKKLVDVMPMLPVTLRKQLRHEFPYYKEPNFKIAAYIDNLLKLQNNIPVMANDILEIIFENLVQIDVNVTRDQIEEAEEIDEESPNLDSDQMKHPVAETLDICMEKVFDYFHTKLKETTTDDCQLMLTQKVLCYFDEQMIKTYTKHVHFLIFYIASFRRSFLTDFLSYLWGKIMDRNQSTTSRQTAIGYISSFMARANFLPLEILKVYLGKLSSWAHNYIKTCDFYRNKNPKAHIVFYAICQAIFYVIALRKRELTKCDTSLEYLMMLDLWPIVKHPLNPLNYCLPAIATIFDKITTDYQILCCHSIIVSNASKSLTTVYTNEQHRPEEFVESVFPFDPYLLKKSGKRIKPLYLEYQSDDGTTPDKDSNEVIFSSPPANPKRRRIESTCELDDFIIRESKIQKIN